MGHRATGRLSDQPRVFRKGAGPMTRRSRCPGLAASGKLAVIDQQVHSARNCVDTDAVTVFNERQRTSDKRLG